MARKKKWMTKKRQRELKGKAWELSIAAFLLGLTIVMIGNTYMGFTKITADRMDFNEAYIIEGEVTKRWGRAGRGNGCPSLCFKVDASDDAFEAYDHIGFDIGRLNENVKVGTFVRLETHDAAYNGPIYNPFRTYAVISLWVDDTQLYSRQNFMTSHGSHEFVTKWLGLLFSIGCIWLCYQMFKHWGKWRVN